MKNRSSEAVHCREYTHGIVPYVRLPFGISSAPGIHRVMDILLQGIPGVVAYIDDILVTWSSDEEHLKAYETLSRLQKAGLRAQLKKCKFMMPSVDYLGIVSTRKNYILFWKRSTPSSKHHRVQAEVILGTTHLL